MRINDLLFEGMTFNPVILKDYDGDKVWSSTDWQSEQLEPCFLCDGTGKMRWSDGEHECDRCKGTGKTLEWVSSAPELSVSNSNGFEIQRMLGIIDPDYSGIIHHQDLPKFMRRLIQLKNQNTSKYTQEPSDERGPMGRQHTDDQGVTHIGHTGPRMIDAGRSQSQIDRYIDELIKIIKFAQEHGASISWG